MSTEYRMIKNLILAVSVICASSVPLDAVATEALSKNASASQEGRVESAKQIIAQAKQFKLNAKQYHTNANASINDANKLKGQAEKLKLQSAAIDANSPKEFQLAINAFKDHAKEYRAHLEAVEKTMGYCKASEAEYQTHLKELTLHTEKFHIAGIRPPHVCGEMQLTSNEASHVANSMRADSVRVAKSEAELANTEEKLQLAIDNSRQATAALAKRNKLQEEERKLAGEFAKLKTEYELLEIQHTALLGTPTPIKNTSVSKTVQGKIKK